MSSYKYHLVERSLTQHWLSRSIWIPLAQKLPAGLKPNTISVSGALCMLASLLFLPLILQGNRWGFLGAALCTLLYFVADNVDGPHARNTGQTSPLGEFLDHWLDAVSGTVLTLVSAICLGLTGEMLLLVAAAVALAYYATLWEQHESGVFHGGRIGSNEGILLTVGLYLLLFAFHGAPWLVYRPGTINFAWVVALLTASMALLTVLQVIWRTRAHLLGLMPMVLAIAAFFLLARAGVVHESLAALGILTANVLLCGPLLLARLAGRHPLHRGMVIGALALAVLLALTIWPSGAVQLLGHRAAVMGSSLLIMGAVSWDLLCASRALKAPFHAEVAS